MENNLNEKWKFPTFLLLYFNAQKEKTKIQFNFSRNLISHRFFDFYMKPVSRRLKFSKRMKINNKIGWLANM